MAAPIYNPVIPCLYPLPGGMYPGRMIRVQGNVPPGAQRFAINLQCGPNTDPRDDIALHLNFRFVEMCVVRNHLSSMEWGVEETDGGIPIRRGEPFEALLLCEPQSIKVALNGIHFCEFLHRTPFQRITHITVDGDVAVQFIGFEGAAPQQPYMVRPQYQPYQYTAYRPYRADPPTYGGQYGPPPPAYGAPGYGAPQGYSAPPPTAVQGYTSAPYGAPQQRSGMGTGAAVGLGVGALAAGGLAGYALGGGFRSDSPPSEVGHGYNPLFDGYNPAFDVGYPMGDGRDTFRSDSENTVEQGSPTAPLAEYPTQTEPESLPIADLAISEPKDNDFDGGDDNDYLEDNAGDGDGVDDDYLENDDNDNNDDGGNNDNDDDYLEDNGDD
ncbi:galectin-4-like isoform X1 [Ostrinia furnacalis]|uniref:galectin-4-like isoform X1 n=1 Tax=Ostrinia furnacalis TaxID=93504 RepID=UPI00103A0FAB|nr:galectin-4-like isoform X1 [Ostrinia furnacalis]